MKLSRILFSGALVLSLFASCATDLDVRQLSPESEFVAPVLNAPGQIVITEESAANEELITFSWSLADFGQPAEIAYNIVASYGGKETTFFARLNGDSYGVKAGELYDKIVNIGVAKGSKANVDFYVSCSLGTDFTTLKSAVRAVPVNIY